METLTPDGATLALIPVSADPWDAGLLPRVVSFNAAFVGAPPQATRRETLIHRPLVSGDSSTSASAVPAWALAVENRSGRALLQENRPLMWRQMLDASPLGGPILIEQSAVHRRRAILEP